MTNIIQKWQNELINKQSEIDNEKIIFDTYKKIMFLTQTYDKDSTIQLKIYKHNKNGRVVASYIRGLINKIPTSTDTYDLKNEFGDSLITTTYQVVITNDVLSIENNAKGIDDFLSAILQTEKLKILYHKLTLEKTIVASTKKLPKNKI